MGQHQHPFGAALAPVGQEVEVDNARPPALAQRRSAQRRLDTAQLLKEGIGVEAGEDTGNRVDEVRLRDAAQRLDQVERGRNALLRDLKALSD